MSGYHDIKRRSTALLIEDDEDYAGMISLILEQGGFNVFRAKDGQLGVEFAQLYDGAIDIVLLDLLLPKKDGFEVFSEIRERHILAGVPIVMLTNLDSPKDREHAKALGVSDYLIKANYTPREILQKVAEHIKDRVPVHA